MGNLSQTSAIMSLITFLQNIGSAIDFDKFPITTKIKKWAGALKNFIMLIANNTLDYLNNHDFRFLMLAILIILSLTTIVPSFISGTHYFYVVFRFGIYFTAALPVFFLSLYQVPIYAQILIVIFSSIIAFTFRYFVCKCWNNAIDDIKYAPSEEDFNEQKKIIYSNHDPEEYLQKIKEGLQSYEPSLCTEITKIFLVSFLVLLPLFLEKKI